MAITDTLESRSIEGGKAEREDATLISESKKVTFYVPDKRALN